MAKTNVELQHLMSSSYSGGSVKDNDRNQQSNTEFNTTPPDTYSTITDAQKEHAQYNSHQVRNPEGSVTSSNPSGGPPYEYDIIPPAGEEAKRGVLRSVREDGGSGGGVTVRDGSTKPGSFRHEAKNIMYEENELKPEKMKHRSLRADSYRTYTGAVYQEPRESYVTCRCKAQNLIVTFFIVMAILFSVASLVLSVLLWFGIYGGASSSDCSCPELGAYEGLIASLDSLEETNANLRAQLENLQNSSATLDDLSAGLAQLEKEKNELNSTIHQLENPDETQTFSATVNNVDIYNDCETKTVGTCAVGHVQTDQNQSPCLTIETSIEVPGKFLQRAYCALGGPGVSLENNTVVATLEIIDDYLRCRCSKVIIDAADLGQTSEIIFCSLYVTRCTTNPSINATLARLP